MSHTKTNPDALPVQLKNFNVGWVFNPNGDKKPRDIEGVQGGWGKPESSKSFDEASTAIIDGKWHNMGYVSKEGCGIIGFDFDNVLAEHRNIDSIVDGAREIFDSITSGGECYAEFSSGGHGLRVVMFGNLPSGLGSGIPKWHFGETVHGGSEAKLEIFGNTTKYVIMTGDALNASTVIDDVKEHTDALLAFNARYGKKPTDHKARAEQALSSGNSSAELADKRVEDYFTSFTVGKGERNENLYNAVQHTRGFDDANDDTIRVEAIKWARRVKLEDHEAIATIESAFKGEPHRENVNREPELTPLLTPQPYIPPADESDAKVDPSLRPANPFIADVQQPMIEKVIELDKTVNGADGLLSRIYNHENLVEDIPCPAMRFGAALYILSADVGHQILYEKRFFSSLSIFISAESGRGKSAAKNPAETIIRKLLPYNQHAYKVTLLATDANMHTSPAGHSNGYNYQDEGSKIFNRLMKAGMHNTESLGIFCDMTDCQTGLKCRGGTNSGDADGTTAPAVSPAITTLIAIQPGLLDGSVSDDFYTSGAAGRFSVGLLHSGKVKEVTGSTMSITGGTGLGSHVATDYANELNTPWIQDEWLTSCSYWPQDGKKARPGDSNVAGRLLQFFGIGKKEFDIAQQATERGQFYFADLIVELFQQICWREQRAPFSDDDDSEEQQDQIVKPELEQPIRINGVEVLPSEITFEQIVDLFCSYNPKSDFALARGLAEVLPSAAATVSEDDFLLAALSEAIGQPVKRSDLTEKFIEKVVNENFLDEDHDTVRSTLSRLAKQSDPRKQSSIDGAASMLTTNIGDWSKHGCKVASVEMLLAAFSEGPQFRIVDLVTVRQGKPPIVHQRALTLPILFRFVELSLMLSGDEQSASTLPDIAGRLLPSMPISAAKLGELSQLWAEHELHGDESAAKMTPRTQTIETRAAAELRAHTERLSASASTLNESSMAERNTATVCKLTNLLAASRCAVSRNEARIHFDDCLEPAQMIADVCRAVLTEQGSIGSRLPANHGMTEDAKTLKRISERLIRLSGDRKATRHAFLSSTVVADPEFIPEPSQWIVLNKNEFVKYVLCARDSDSRRAATAQLYDCVSANPMYLRLCKYERGSEGETKVWPARDSREANGFLIARALFEGAK